VTEEVPFTLSPTASNAIAQDIAGYGTAHRAETGGFLLTLRGTNNVDVVALAGSLGITRAFAQFRISGAAIDTLSEWAEERNHRIVGQYHSHCQDAFLSEIDRRSGFCVEGFVSAVVPDFEAPTSDPARWGWWRYTAGEWRQLVGPPTTTAQVEVITFDEGGIR
jgi:proteasome lid subunit RPN8/RPN11